jgi:hypothetical protein
MELMYLVFLFFFLIYLYVWFILENDIKRILLDKSFCISTVSSDKGSFFDQDRK